MDDEDKSYPDSLKQRVIEYLLFKVWAAILVVLAFFFLGMALGVFWLQELIKHNA